MPNQQNRWRWGTRAAGKIFEIFSESLSSGICSVSKQVKEVFELSAALVIKSMEFSQWKVAQLTGRLDAFSGQSVMKSLRQLMDGDHPHWALDLGDVEFLNVAAINEALKLSRELSSRSGQLVLFRPAPAILRHIESFAGHEFEVYFNWDELRTGMTFHPRSEHFYNSQSASLRSL